MLNSDFLEKSEILVRACVYVCVFFQKRHHFDIICSPDLECRHKIE